MTVFVAGKRKPNATSIVQIRFSFTAGKDGDDSFSLMICEDGTVIGYEYRPLFHRKNRAVYTPVDINKGGGIYDPSLQEVESAIEIVRKLIASQKN